MARSASVDPIEKFRFNVTVLNLDISTTAAAETLATALVEFGGTDARGVGKYFSILGRAGFASVTPPKLTTTVMEYRENLDNFRITKAAGITRYEPVTLSRGVTDGIFSRDLYNWHRLVNNEMALMSVSNELTRDVNIVPKQKLEYRRDVVISVQDREGKSIKQWILFNAWPIAYTPGDSLDALSNDKLIEDLTLTYEFFIELEGGLDGFIKETLRDSIEDQLDKLADKFF